MTYFDKGVMIGSWALIIIGATLLGGWGGFFLGLGIPSLFGKMLHGAADIVAASGRGGS